MRGEARDVVGWRVLAKLLDEAYVRATSMPTAELIAEFDRVQTAFLQDRNPPSGKLLEAKRRVAEGKFFALSQRHLEVDTVAALLNDIRTLGYSNPEREATVEIVFARFLIRQGRIEQAKEHLACVRDRFAKMQFGADTEFYKYSATTCESLLSEIGRGTAEE